MSRGSINYEEVRIRGDFEEESRAKVRNDNTTSFTFYTRVLHAVDTVWRKKKRSRLVSNIYIYIYLNEIFVVFSSLVSL